MGGGVDIPISVIAKWPVPSTNPVLRSKSDWIICVLFMVIATLATVMRFWARGMIQRRIDIDDYFIVGGLIFTLGMGIMTCLGMTKYHYNRHVWDAFVDTDMLVKGRRVVWAIEALNLSGTGFTKISILLFVRRLTIGNSTKTIIYTIWFTIAFVALTTVVFEITLLLECRPITAFWNKVDIRYVLGGNEFYCVNEGAKLMAASVISAFQDFMVTTIPLVLLWRLQIQRMKKAGIIAVFALGYLTCAIGIVRIGYTYNVYFQTYDQTWYGPNLMIWVTIELCLGIVCACAPALKTFFGHYKISSLGSRLTYSFGIKSYASRSRLTNVDKSADHEGEFRGLYTQELSRIDRKSQTEDVC